MARKLILAAAFAGAAALTTAAAFGQDDDPVVATVGDHEIRASEAMAAVEALPPQYRQVPTEMLIPTIAEQLAIGRLILDRAEEADLINDPDVQERLADAERSIVQEVWLDRAVADRLTDERLAEAYDTFIADNPPVEEVSARHILVETEDEASALIDQLNEGADFAELAREHSVGPSGQDGGDLGFFQQDQMVEPFGSVAFSLESGEYTQDPVETQFGFHVILVEDRRVTEPPPIDAVEPELMNQLEQDITREVLVELREGADIVLYGPDGEPLPEEGAAEDAIEDATEDGGATDETGEDAPAAE